MYVCMSGIIRRMVVRAPFGNCETRCMCSETKCNSYKHGLLRYTGGSDPAKCVLRINSKPSVRYLRLLLLALVSLDDEQAACTDTETGKTPTVDRGPGEYSSIASSIRTGTRVPWYASTPLYECLAGTQPALYPLPPSSRRLPCL